MTSPVIIDKDQSLILAIDTSDTSMVIAVEVEYGSTEIYAPIYGPSATAATRICDIQAIVIP